MRLEAGMRTQDALARALNERGFPYSRRWVTGIESGEFEPDLATVAALADLLRVDLRFLVLGKVSGDSEFVARLRGYEAGLDARARRVVLAVAAQQAEELRDDAEGREAAIRRFLADPTVEADFAAWLAAGSVTLPAPATEAAAEAPAQPQRRRGRART